MNMPVINRKGWVFPTLCGWCIPDRIVTHNGSHTICDRHLREMVDEARGEAKQS